MADESLREIQLNGKQLVFLFMTATVVAVVIFLSGVMVGRGVRTPAIEEVQASTEGLIDPTIPPSSAVGTSASTASPASNETLTYPSRLEGEDPPVESLEEPEDPTALPPATPAPRAAASVDDRPVTPAPVATSAAAADGALSAEPAGPGYVVQVAATKERSEADTIARRLLGKGYPAFVTTPPSGPQMFRVRVGKYLDRKEADRVAARLQKEEQFKPWITR